jgi:hypothetical protein
MTTPTHSRLAALATVALAVAVPATALAAPAQPVPQVDATHDVRHAHHARNLQKGIVVECTSGARRLEAFVSLYENSRYVNVLQVVVGDPDQGLGDSVENPRGFVRGRRAFGRLELGGEVAKVSGSVVRKGPRTRVHEVVEDAGERIVSRGWHRPLVTDLRLAYGDVSVPLNCDAAFAYHLHVTRTPIDG